MSYRPLKRKVGSERGYTLLFAVLTATLVLGVAAFILVVSRGQFLLATTARESLFSFYAADSGIECELKNLADVTTAGATIPACGGGTSGGTPSGGSMTFLAASSGTGYDSNIVPIFFDNNTECALIRVHLDSSSQGSIRNFDALGYNVGCESVGGVWQPKAAPQATERGITYTAFGGAAIQ